MPPPPPNYGNPYQQAQGGYQQHMGGTMGMQIDHPKASTINTLGLIGLILTFLIGFIGLILNIINLAISASVVREIRENPGKYSEASIKKIKTGRTCSIVGLSIQGALILIVIVIIAVVS